MRLDGNARRLSPVRVTGTQVPAPTCRWKLRADRGDRGCRAAVRHAADAGQRRPLSRPGPVPMTETPALGHRETSGATTALLLTYVRERAGQEAVEEVLRRADVP